MLLHRRIALALAHLRAARYDGCASDIVLVNLDRINDALTGIEIIRSESVET